MSEQSTPYREPLYIHSYILKEDGSVYETEMNVSNFSFDYRQYLDNAKLYFIEKQKDGQMKKNITTLDNWNEELMRYGNVADYFNLRLNSSRANASGTPQTVTSTKKLGIGHIIISYIWLPIMIITLFLSTIGTITTALSDLPKNLNVSVMADMALLLPALFLALSAFIGMIRRHINAVTTINMFFVCYFAYYVLCCIGSVISYEVSFIAFLISAIIIAALLFFIYRYYKNRCELFTNEPTSYLDKNAVNILYYFYGFCLCLLPLTIDGMSLYYMFRESVSYGLFGLFVPVIAQIQFLFHTGFTTNFAYLVYGTVLVFGCFSVLSFVVDNK